MHKSALVVFAKKPIPGSVKTRIAASAGTDKALDIYNELLRHLASTLHKTDYHVAFCPGTDPGILREIFIGAQSFIPQKGTTLAHRLNNAFNYFFGAGCHSVCAIGCDCPAITIKHITLASEYLASGSDVVIGPAFDGGYYLIGARPEAVSVFSVDGFETGTLYRNTVTHIELNEYTMSILETLNDIDTLDDYTQWKLSQSH